MQMDRLIAPEEVAEVLGVKEATLATWRCTKRYDLPHVKVGRLVMYRQADVERFILSRVEGEWDIQGRCVDKGGRR